jgi:hypothetical protein
MAFFNLQKRNYTPSSWLGNFRSRLLVKFGGFTFAEQLFQTRNVPPLG